ncbi:hypothetical protein AAVH_35020 [Aphelenchoides avenae]|nr:hypothetical protein AAVH_35020 [Aphelenchus avenae]
MHHENLEGLLAVQSFLPYVNDLQAFCSPICLLLTSSKVRNSFTTLYRIRRATTETTPVNPSSSD